MSNITQITQNFSGNGAIGNIFDSSVRQFFNRDSQRGIDNTPNGNDPKIIQNTGKNMTVNSYPEFPSINNSIIGNGFGGRVFINGKEVKPHDKSRPSVQVLKKTDIKDESDIRKIEDINCDKIYPTGTSGGGTIFKASGTKETTFPIPMYEPQKEKAKEIVSWKLSIVGVDSSGNEIKGEFMYPVSIPTISVTCTSVDLIESLSGDIHIIGNNSVCNTKTGSVIVSGDVGSCTTQTGAISAKSIGKASSVTGNIRLKS